MEECPNCHNANKYGDYEGPTCDVCLGEGFVPESERTVWHMVADLHNPAPEPFAVIRADTAVRSGNGVEGTVVSLHHSREEAEAVAKVLDGEKPH